MEFLNNNQIDLYIIETLAINLTISVMFISFFLYIFKSKDSVNIAGYIISYSMILSATGEIEYAQNIVNEIILFIAITSLGMMMIFISHFLLIKISKNYAQNSNLFHTINVISLSIMLRAIMIWVDFISWEGLFIFISVYMLNTAIFGLFSNSKYNVIKSLGHNIGLALILTTSLVFVPYDITDISNLIFYHAIYSIILTIIFIFVAKLIDLLTIKIYSNKFDLSIISSSIKLFIGMCFSNLI